MNLTRTFLSLAFALGVQSIATFAQSGSNTALRVDDLVGRRVVFVGDSITYGGEYIEFVESVLRWKHPEKRLDWINLGLPSETVSGLSEPGHAGGQFPRPTLHERLGRLLQQT